MRFLLAVFVDEKKMAALSPTEAQNLDEMSLGHDEDLRASGHFVAAQALQPSPSAATVKVRKGKVTVTDGPFAETKEQIGGFLLIEAKDRDEAIALASKVPVASYATIEVRPIKELKAHKEHSWKAPQS